MMKKIIIMAFFIALEGLILAQTGVTAIVGESDVSQSASQDDRRAASEKNQLHALEEHAKFRKEYTLTQEEWNVRVRERFCRERATGKDEREIFSLQLEEAIHDGYYEEVQGLRGWMEQYDGELLKGSSYFNFMEKWDYNFSSPELALRSYWHALTKCDAEIILRHSDPSFIKYLERAKKWNLFIEPKKYLNDGMSKVVPLLTGSCVIAGKRYIAIFYRREFPVDPKSNEVCFHWDFFVFMNGRYFCSDAPSSSNFGNMAQVMRLKAYPMAKYPDFVERLKGTDVPPSFYEIGEEVSPERD